MGFNRTFLIWLLPCLMLNEPAKLLDLSENNFCSHRSAVNGWKFFSTLHMIFFPNGAFLPVSTRLHYRNVFFLY